MSTLRLRHTARTLLFDEQDRVLLARHDTPWQEAIVWAPPGGKVEAGETIVEAALRELMEEVGYRASAADVRHVWHEQVVSPRYAEGWDGAIHDYFLLRCEAFEVQGTFSPEQLAAEDITGFHWWSLSELETHTGPELFSPRAMPALVRDLVARVDADYPLILGSSTC